MVKLKIVIVLLAGVLVLADVVRAVRISLAEKAPAFVRLDHWTQDYHGQQWIRLTGHADPGRGVDVGKIAFVPMVSPDEEGGDPVHAVIVTVPRRRQVINGDITVQGILAAKNSWDLGRILPRENFAADVVCLKEGTQPDGIGVPVFMGAIGVSLVLLAVFWLGRKVQARRAGASRSL
jgi:hypothetical protein